MSHRLNRVKSQIRRLLSELITREIKEPDIGIVTVCGVDLSQDFSLAKVYITVFPEEKIDNTLLVLGRSTWLLQSLLGKQLHLRMTPKLIFLYDTSFEYGAKMDDLIRQARKMDG